MRKRKKTRKHIPKELDITIDSLARGGDGVGRVDGKVCFVPFSVPGDKLKISTTAENKKMIRAEIQTIISPSKYRISPKCPLFEQCGGCQWQHISPEKQLKAKQSILKRALNREDAKIVGSKKNDAYRRIARLHYNPTSQCLGFVGTDQKSIIDLSNPANPCSVLAPALNATLGPLKKLAQDTIFEPVEIRLTQGNNGVTATVVGDNPLGQAFYQQFGQLVPEVFIGACTDFQGIFGLVGGVDYTEQDAWDEQALWLPAVGFGQANSHVNNRLVETVSQWVEQGAYKSCIELFSGAGNFTVALAKHIEKLSTAELDPAACKIAKKNLTVRDFKKVQVICGDALEIYQTQGQNKSLVFLDPPRSGNLQLATLIASGNHLSVIYVSCDPMTLARDLRPLAQAGFVVEKAIGFDMFPQTTHMEVAVLLTKEA